MLEKINEIESAVLSGSHSPWFPINIQSISLSLMQSKVKSRKSEYTFPISTLANREVFPAYTHTHTHTHRPFEIKNVRSCTVHAEHTYKEYVRFRFIYFYLKGFSNIQENSNQNFIICLI